MVTLLEGDYTQEWYDAAKTDKIVGMDIETSGLDINTDRIATVQMFVPNKGTVMVRKLHNPLVILRLLEDPKIRKVFHHAPFDLSFIMRDFNVYPENIADTKIAAKFVDPKRQRFIHPDTNKGSHSLISLVWYFFRERLDKSLAISNWFSDTLSPAQLAYAAKDVIYLPTMLDLMEKEIKRNKEIKCAQKTMNNIPTHVLLQLKKYNDIYSY